MCFIHLPYFCNFLETLIFCIAWFNVKSLVMTSHKVLVNLWFIWSVKTFCHSVEDDFLVVFRNEKLNFQMEKKKSTLVLKWHFALQELKYFQIFLFLLPNFTSFCQILFKYANRFSTLIFFPHNDFPDHFDHFGKCIMNHTYTVLCSWYSSCDFMVTYVFRVYHQLLLMVFLKILTVSTWQA